MIYDSLPTWRGVWMIQVNLWSIRNIISDCGVVVWMVASIWQVFFSFTLEQSRATLGRTRRERHFGSWDLSGKHEARPRIILTIFTSSWNTQHTCMYIWWCSVDLLRDISTLWSKCWTDVAMRSKLCRPHQWLRLHIREGWPLAQSTSGEE